MVAWEINDTSVRKNSNATAVGTLSFVWSFHAPSLLLFMSAVLGVVVLSLQLYVCLTKLLHVIISCRLDLGDRGGWGEGGPNHCVLLCLQNKILYPCFFLNRMRPCRFKHHKLHVIGTYSRCVLYSSSLKQCACYSMNHDYCDWYTTNLADYRSWTTFSLSIL